VTTPSQLVIRFAGLLVAKERPRFVGRAVTPEKTRRASDALARAAVAQVGTPGLEGALAVEITAGLAIPPSWPERKKALARAGTVRPTARNDVDNLAKTALDALNGLVWQDDGQIVTLSVSKWYADPPETLIVIQRIND
jgi:Holliday junction resolvase RusA-like endonuclease